MNFVVDHDPDPSDSRVQAQVELAMLGRLSFSQPRWTRLSWKDASQRLNLPVVWRKAKPDAVWIDGDTIVVAEAYARIGAFSSGHRRKVAMDVLKLISIRAVAALEECNFRLLLVLPTDAIIHLNGSGWFSEAIKVVELTPVELCESERRILRDACARQATGQARTRRI